MTDIFMRNLDVPKHKVDVILDTDAFNEIDDQFAIAYMLAAKEKINTIGITAAPFHNKRSVSAFDGMVKSYNEILKIYALIGEKQLIQSTFKGSDRFLESETVPVYSEAAAFIAEQAKRYTPENPLYIVGIGAATNIASAILIAPDAIKQNTVIVWLGGHAHANTYNNEFNLQQDVAAGRILFGCGAPLVQLPAVGVVDAFTTTEHELKHWLGGKNAVAEYLVHNTVRTAESYAKGRVWSRCIWDVTAIAWILNENNRFMDSYLTAAPIPEYDHHYAHNAKNHFMRYVCKIHRDSLMQDLFDKLLSYK